MNDGGRPEGRPLLRRLRGDDGVGLRELGLNGLAFRRSRFRGLRKVVAQLQPFLTAVTTTMYGGVP